MLGGMLWEWGCACHRACMACTTPPPDRILDRGLWKHYLPATTVTERKIRTFNVHKWLLNICNCIFCRNISNIWDAKSTEITRWKAKTNLFGNSSPCLISYLLMWRFLIYLCYLFPYLFCLWRHSSGTNAYVQWRGVTAVPCCTRFRHSGSTGQHPSLLERNQNFKRIDLYHFYKNNF